MLSIPNHMRFAVTFILATSATAFSAPVYTVTDLGAIYGDPRYLLLDDVTDIGDNGEVVGFSTAEDGMSQANATIFSNGSRQSIGSLGGSFSSALGVNASGQIVGRTAVPNSGLTDAFLYSNGQMTDLGSLSPYGGSTATDINASGQVTGYSLSVNGPGSQHAFLYSNGVMHDLGAPANTLGTQGNAINDLGQIAGTVTTFTGIGYPPGGAQHALFIDSDGSMHDLGTLGGTQSIAYSINNGGQIVGSADVASDNLHAFLFDNGTMQDLGTFGGAESQAFGINNQGQIVGYSTNYFGFESAFIYTGGAMMDLNNLIGDANESWFLKRAAAINDSGQIIGYGQVFTDRFLHAYLLTPVPEVSPISFLGVALTILLGAKWINSRNMTKQG